MNTLLLVLTIWFLANAAFILIMTPPKVKPMTAYRVVKEFPPSEPIVSMIAFKDYVLVATARCVYKMTKDEKFEALEFHVPEEVFVETRR